MWPSNEFEFETPDLKYFAIEQRCFLLFLSKDLILPENLVKSSYFKRNVWTNVIYVRKNDDNIWKIN